MKIIRTDLLTTVLTTMVTAFAPIILADDTEIYVNEQIASGAQPLVMFTLDFRPNLASEVCKRSVTVVQDDPDTPEDETVSENECQFLVDGGFLAGDPATGLVPASVKLLEMLRAALKAVFSEINPAVKIGLMLNHQNINNCEGQENNNRCSNGGYIMAGFEAIDKDNLAGMNFFKKLAAIPLALGNVSHPYQGKELFYEFFLYLIGGKIYNGHVGWQDFGTNGDYNLDDDEDTVHPMSPDPTQDGIKELIWDESIETNSHNKYVSPLENLAACSKIFTINLLFQVAQSEDDSDNAILSGTFNQANNPDGMTGIDLSGNRNSFDTVIEYLNDKDLSLHGVTDKDADGNLIDPIPGKQNVTSYFIGSEQADNLTVTGYAVAGGTNQGYDLIDDPRGLISLIRRILEEILSTSTTFVAPSIPVNVFNQVERLPEVYISLFQADEDGFPFWNGNLKKLQVDTDNLLLVDQNDKFAVGEEGRIAASALTFWTDPNDLPAETPDPLNPEFETGTDGRRVPRGGAGSRIPGFRNATGVDPGFTNPIGTVNKDTHRVIYTDVPTLVDGNSNLVPFNAADTDAGPGGLAQSLLTEGINADKLFEAVTGITNGSWSLATTTQQATALTKLLTLMRWNRGWDRVEDTGAPGTFIYVKRNWFQASAIHSRPVPINYGDSDGTGTTFSKDNPNVRIIMASNEGLIRMVQANETPEPTRGVEKWAILPREVIYKTQRLMVNNPSPPAPRHPYIVDGEITVYTDDLNSDGNLVAADGDRAIMFVGMRRGGKTYMAIDISDPDAPKMLWRIRSGDTGFEQLAQTWSQVRVGTINVDLNEDGDTDDTVDGLREGLRPMLLIGGGYNGDDDSDDIPDPGETDLGKDERNVDADTPFVGKDDIEGNAIFIVDALTGKLIWKAVKTPAGETAGPQSDKSLFYHDHLVDSIPASLTIADTGGDNSIDRFYVGDTGGVVWRGDLVNTFRSSWQVTRILSVGRHYNTARVDTDTAVVSFTDNANDRRFHHRPDFVEAKDELGNPFDAVIIGSGDRPNPLGTKVENFFYMFKDNPAVPTLADESTNLKYHDDLADLTDNCAQLENCDADTTTALAASGWKIQLLNCDAAPSEAADCGEKILARALTVDGVIFFTSYLPPGTNNTTSCVAEGSGLFYKVDLFNAGGIENFDLSNDTNGITLERFEKLSSPGIPAHLVPSGNNTAIRPDLKIEEISGASGRRSYWYERYQKTTTPSS